MQETTERAAGIEGSPAREEFEAAKRREVARLNVRVAPMLGSIPAPEDLEVLWLDEPADEWRDREIVRKWVAVMGGKDHR